MPIINTRVIEADSTSVVITLILLFVAGWVIRKSLEAKQEQKRRNLEEFTPREIAKMIAAKPHLLVKKEIDPQLKHLVLNLKYGMRSTDGVRITFPFHHPDFKFLEQSRQSSLITFDALDVPLRQVRRDNVAAYLRVRTPE